MPVLLLGARADGKVSLEEYEANLYPKTRRKIEEKLSSGWKFDHAKWAASMARHQKWDMARVFQQFDADGDSKLSMREVRARAHASPPLARRQMHLHSRW